MTTPPEQWEDVAGLRGRFPAGSIVDVTVRGLRVIDEGTYPAMGQLKFCDGPDILIFAMNGPDVEISASGWPPQADDLWRDGDGKRWFAQMDSQTGEIFLIAMAGNGATIQYACARLAAEVGPLTLVHREQQDGGQSHG